MAGSPEPDRSTGRRAYDREVDPVIETFVERRLGETRHMLRSELTVAMIDVTNKITGLAASISDHQIEEARRSTVTTEKLDQIGRDLGDMKPKVEALILTDASDHASSTTRDQLLDRLDRTRKWAIAQTIAIVAVIVTVLAIYLQHH